MVTSGLLFVFLAPMILKLLLLQKLFPNSRRSIHKVLLLRVSFLLLLLTPRLPCKWSNQMFGRLSCHYLQAHLGGPDGFRPHHLKDLMQCHESGAEFLCASTAFINTVLSDRCLSNIVAIFFGGQLLALNNKAANHSVRRYRRFLLSGHV